MDCFMCVFCVYLVQSELVRRYDLLTCWFGEEMSNGG